MLKSARIAAAGIILAMISPSSVRADAAASATITYAGPGAGGALDGPHSGANHAQASASDAANHAEAEADAWTFKSYAKLGLAAGQSAGQAAGTASYHDSITVSATDPGVIAFIFHVHGTMMPGTDYTLTALYNGNLVDNPTWSYEDPNIDQLWGFSVPFTPGVPFDFQVESGSRAFQTTGGTGGPVVCDFSNTTWLESIQTDQFSATVTGASGFDYQFLVPEPTGLLGLGLTALLVRRRISVSPQSHRAKSPS